MIGALMTMPRLGAKASLAALPYAIKKQEEVMAYRVYMTDLALAQAKCLIRPKQEPPRYYEMINPKPEETRTGDEIIEHIKQKLREVR